MSEKVKKIISIVLLVIPSLMLVMSGVMKLSGAAEIAEGFTKMGILPLMRPFGIIELAAVTLLWIPKTYKLGFLLLCCYLGGALSIELSTAQAPVAAGLLAVLWTGMFLKDKKVFLNA